MQIPHEAVLLRIFIGESDRWLEVGEVANLVLFDLPTDSTSPLAMRMTINRGETVYKLA